MTNANYWEFMEYNINIWWFEFYLAN